MKKVVTLIYLVAMVMNADAQIENMNKGETVAMLASEFSEAKSLILDAEDDIVISKSNLSFKKGILTISQTKTKKGQLFNEYAVSFSPLFMESFVDGSNDYKRTSEDKVGQLRIYIYRTF